MLAEGFSTKRGRRSALIHHDGVNHRLRGRRGARLVALTSGGAIPDNADYRVILDPSETFVGTVNEDFAVESLAGDIFQWATLVRILRINSSVARVECEGQPPVPFGSVKPRRRSSCRMPSRFRMQIETRLLVDKIPSVSSGNEVSADAAEQLGDHLTLTARAGFFTANLADETFFDESGGTQLWISPLSGNRIVLGLAQKRFGRCSELSSGHRRR
jgi:ATP-dependent Lhr-like helicase